MNSANDEVSSAEQMRRALELSQQDFEEHNDRDLNAVLDESRAVHESQSVVEDSNELELARQMSIRDFELDEFNRLQERFGVDASQSHDDEQFERIRQESLQAYFDDLAKKAANRSVSGTKATTSTKGTAGPAPESTSGINNEIDRAYQESLRIDAERSRLEELRQQQEILDRQRRAEQQIANQETISVFESTYLNGDVTVRFEYRAAILIELKLNINTPIRLLTQYLSLKYNLQNVELLMPPNVQFGINMNLSDYTQSGKRIKVTITAEAQAAGSYRRISIRQNNQINNNKNSNRQNNKRNRQNNKRNSQNNKRNSQNNKRNRQNNKRNSRRISK